MRRQFLSVYVGVAAIVLIVQVLGVIAVRRTVVEEADRRLVETMTPAVRVMQRRFSRHREMVGGPGRTMPMSGGTGTFPPAAEEHRPPVPPGPRGQFLQDIMEHHGLGARIVHAGELRLDPGELRALQNNEVVLVRRDASRLLMGALGESDMIALGPLPAGDPGPLLWRMTLQSALVLIAIGGVLLMLLRPFERRLHRLADAATALGEGDLDARVRDPAGDAIGTVSTAFDAMAYELGRVIAGQRELLRAVAHELRTPLARMFFLADELRETADASGRLQRVERLEASLEEMRSLVDELLQFSRLSGPEAVVEGDEVELGAVMADVGLRASELQGDVTVTVSPAEEVRVVGSPRLLRRAIDNVVTNAVRHAKSRVEVSVVVVGGKARVVVDDDGPGIPPSDRDRVFEPFTRLDGSRARSDGGVGLGLAIVRRVMEAQEGSARVEDSPLGGARFVLELPDGLDRG